MKNKRQLAISEIIKANDITTQNQLVTKLNEQGYDVTQATVSRDIRQMHLKKEAKGKEKPHYVLPQIQETLSGPYKRVLKESVISVDVAMNLLVIKTRPGMAMAVAASVDSLKYPEIVGTIAGDDTVMIAIKTVNDAVVVQKRIELLLSEA